MIFTHYLKSILLKFGSKENDHQELDISTKCEGEIAIVINIRIEMFVFILSQDLN